MMFLRQSVGRLAQASGRIATTVLVPHIHGDITSILGARVSRVCVSFLLAAVTGVTSKFIPQRLLRIDSIMSRVSELGRTQSSIQYFQR